VVIVSTAEEVSIGRARAKHSASQRSKDAKQRGGLVGGGCRLGGSGAAVARLRLQQAAVGAVVVGALANSGRSMSCMHV